MWPPRTIQCNNDNNNNNNNVILEGIAVFSVHAPPAVDSLFFVHIQRFSMTGIPEFLAPPGLDPLYVTHLAVLRDRHASRTGRPCSVFLGRAHCIRTSVFADQAVAFLLRPTGIPLFSLGVPAALVLHHLSSPVFSYKPLACWGWNPVLSSTYTAPHTMILLMVDRTFAQ